MQEPKAAGGSENAIILIESARAGSSEEYFAIISANTKDVSEKNVESRIEKAVDKRIIRVTL